MSHTIRAAVLLLGLFAFACGETQAPVDPDAGLVDETPDAGEETPDAGEETPDAGEETPDAGEDPVDAGEEQPDAGEEEQPDAGEEEPPKVLRFVVIGDQGEGNDKQFMVAEQIKRKCDADGCDFVMLLGDNFYDEGVTSLDDPQWLSKFEEPYAEIDVPFYAVLGNHDYGGHDLVKGQGGIGAQWNRGPIEVNYTQISNKWRMPSTFYTMKHQNACFMMLDTNSIFWDDDRYGDQKTWYAPALQAMQPCEWVFVAGHHCYRSNGKHGNAGSYEGIDTSWIKWLGDFGFFDGRHIKNYFDNVVKDSADVLLAGHDHNRQWLEPEASLGGAEVIVSGAGAKVTGDESRGNPTYFENFTTPGFLWIQLEGKTMTGQFYDMHGTFEFERVVTKP